MSYYVLVFNQQYYKNMNKTSTSTKLDFKDNYTSKRNKNKDIRYTILYVLAAAFAAILLLDIF